MRGRSMNLLDYNKEAKMQEAKMRVAIYARVSTDKQDNENQLLQLRDFAAQQGWRVVREYVDYETGSKS